MTDEMTTAVNAILARARKELEAMGLECSMVWRCPNGAADQVGHLFVGQTYEDVDVARAAGYGAGAAPQAAGSRSPRS
jgi:hypothetical protein